MTDTALTQTRSPNNPTSINWVLPVSILGSSLGFIDSSVVNVALPAIQDDFNSGLATVQWVSNAYMLTLASLILLGGALGDRYGTLRVFKIGLTIFVLASIGCGFAISAPLLIAARFIQGGSAALLVPTSLALISQAYTGEERGKAIGTWAAAGGVLLALGPPLGGWLVDNAGWRSIFFINVPIAGAALLLSSRIAIQPSSRTDACHLDLVGSALAVLTLGTFTYGMVELGQGSFLVGTTAVFVSIPLALAFIFIEKQTAAPIMPLRLFKNRNFAGANALTFVLYAGLSGALFVLPFVLIRVHHYSVTQAGAAFLPFSIILGLGSRLAGRVASKTGRRLPLIVGPLITASGFAALALSGRNPDYLSGYMPGLIAIGIGMTLAIPALTMTVFDSSPNKDSGAASGINNAAARSGGLIAVGALGIAFGGSDFSSLSERDIAAAYSVIMWSSALAAAISVACATFAITANGEAE
ncbi:EmrB/QacA subfamily drug resistance transporter [Phyllobacterium sp. 1468]|uniref:MFS transporter n=1 Tax=Phyllobacterium sp. 1468 TaxID=2817759 RepID=UPI0028642355|nr:MFS transporter [Phyllobacterium sp. 1468]MDR6632594.1 EmrB/QacA subfamily drug resistance transporter [Phyllobacterium sp. 1468]